MPRSRTWRSGEAHPGGRVRRVRVLITDPFDIEALGFDRLEPVKNDRDAKTITDKILGIAIADVSGHGLPAALQVRDEASIVEGRMFTPGSSEIVVQPAGCGVTAPHCPWADAGETDRAMPRTTRHAATDQPLARVRDLIRISPHSSRSMPD